MESIPEAVSKRNRIRKFNIFMNTFEPNSMSKILDVGANDVEFSENDNMLEKLYENKSNITVLGVHEYDEFRKKYPDVKVIKYDGKVFPFSDKEFDFGWSNAVLEHVGDFDSQILFVKEIVRTCEKVFITTPNRYFPFEIHTRIPLLHYFPKAVFDWVVGFTRKKWATGSYMFLLSERKIKKILKSAGVNNYKIIKNRFCFFVLDFVIIIY